MVKKAKKKTRKRKVRTTDWAQGQPLAFPKEKNPADINLLAREVVEAAIGEPLGSQKQRSKKSLKKR